MTESFSLNHPAQALPFLQLIPEYRDYMWGGDRLRPGQLTAEAWVIYENNRVAAGGAFSGRKLSDLVTEYGQALLGRRPFQQTGARFPLLVKLLDCVQWLSIQVHPNDEQAQRLEGPGFFGKTEAWHVLEASPDATLIAGSKPGVSPERLMDAIRNGTIVEQLQVSPVSQGDTIFIRPGTIHALGPGLLIYEIQQTSDLTYRVFDWNRPLSAGRTLHIDKSLDVSDPLASAAPIPLPDLAHTQQVLLTQCSYFQLEMLVMESEPVKLATTGESFQALTVIEGQATLKSEREELTLNRFESLIVPASYGAYEIHPQGALRLLKASV
ncbi:MAG: type I phosphomannose isomerase catalytic subunit [Chloroflexota bacterium]